MAYLYVILLTIAFSFGGMFIRYSGEVFSSSFLSFLRFFIGIIVLVIIELWGRRKPRTVLTNKFIWLGAAGKAVQYLGENFGVAHGVAYGNILIQPIQTVTILILAILLFKEKFPLRKGLGTFLCVAGIICVSWNGAPLSKYMQGNAINLLAFVVAGIGGGLFIISQKQLIHQMDARDMNLNMFMIAAAICFLPLPAEGAVVVGPVTPFALFTVLFLGLITGAGFLIQALALKELSPLVVSLILSLAGVLQLLWTSLFTGVKISLYVIGGTVVFVIGMWLINSFKARTVQPALGKAV